MMKFRIFCVFVLARPPQVPILLKNFLNEFTEFFVTLFFCIFIEKLTGSHIQVMEYFASSLYLRLKTFTTLKINEASEKEDVSIESSRF